MTVVRRKAQEPLPACKSCGVPLAKRRGGKVKLMVRSRCVAFSASGEAEMVCPACGDDTPIPGVVFRLSGGAT